MKNLDKNILNKRLTNLGGRSRSSSREKENNGIDYMDDPAIDPVQREINKFYENPQHTVETFAMEKYGISPHQIRSDKKIRDQIKMEIFLENYAN